MKTVRYSLKTPTGHITVRVPVKQLEIYNVIRNQYLVDEEAFSEARRLYIEQYPEEAREFYGEKM
jgi:hypothetical protein